MRVQRTIDATGYRGQRIVLTTRLRTGAQGQAEVAVIDEDARARASDWSGAQRGALRRPAQATESLVLDVAASARTLAIELALTGAGDAWFEDVELRVVPRDPASAPHPLTGRQVTNVAALLRVATYVRYLHPADEAAAADWDAQLPVAVSEVLARDTRAGLVAALRSWLATVAPTATISEAGDRAAPLDRPARATQLVRWRYLGLPPSPPFSAFREPRDREGLSAYQAFTIPLDAGRRCQRLEVRAHARRTPGTGTAALELVTFQPGTKQRTQTAAVEDGPAREVSVVAEPGADTVRAELRLTVEGAAGLEATNARLRCDALEQPLDLGSLPARPGGLSEAFRWGPSPCGGSTCVSLTRIPDQERTATDLAEVELGDGLVAHVPLAVWSTPERTLPITPPSPRAPTGYGADDLPVRLAGVGALWGAATLFHAYHDGAARSWQQALEAAITAVAIAPDRAAVHAILRGLVVGLADNHAAVTHPMALVDGMLPMAFRRFGDRIVVAGTVAQLAGDVIAGDELIAIDDVPARIAYTRAAGVTSAATPGYHELASLVRMSRGPRGAIRTLVLQRAPGQTTTRYFPLVSYAAYDHQVLGPRPKTGSEVAPGVYYVDIEELTTATWTKLVTGLRSARSVIVDLRGYSASIMAVLASFLTQEIASPVWCIPVRPRAAFAGCVKSRWSVRPAADHLTARLLVLVDAHTTSAMETALQMIVDHGLATTLGETSGGTNGNIANVQLPGGFEARFTGMRAERPDGSTIHGRGIVPDVVVHPTLAGLRAGRDEILEAAIARAQAP